MEACQANLERLRGGAEALSLSPKVASSEWGMIKDGSRYRVGQDLKNEGEGKDQWDELLLSHTVTAPVLRKKKKKKKKQEAIGRWRESQPTTKYLRGTARWPA